VISLSITTTPSISFENGACAQGCVKMTVFGNLNRFEEAE